MIYINTYVIYMVKIQLKILAGPLRFKQNLYTPQQRGVQTGEMYAHTFLMYHNEQETYLMKYFQRSIFNYHLQST